MKAPLPYRIIFDSESVVQLHTVLGKDKFSHFLFNLMYVNSNSLLHKKNHIITSQKSFDVITSNIVDMINPEHQGWIPAAIRPQTENDLESIDDEIERIWEYAILVSSKAHPYQTIIFTTDANKPRYEQLKIKDKKSNILIETDGQIDERINDFYNICRAYKQN